MVLGRRGLLRVLEKTLESPCKEIQPVHPGNQSWIFTGGTDTEAETPILWLPDAKKGLIAKDLDAGKDWRREEKGRTGDEMAGWHHWLDGHEFEQTPGDGEGQGSLACCSPCCRKELGTTERLNNSSWEGVRWTALMGEAFSMHHVLKGLPVESVPTSFPEVSHISYSTSFVKIFLILPTRFDFSSLDFHGTSA